MDERRSPRIGVLSDTHGQLSPDAIRELQGVDHIVHAGDIGGPSILEALSAIAPVTAVAGNQDVGKFGDLLTAEIDADLDGVRVVVGHKRKRLMKRLASGKVGIAPAGGPPQLVVYGHEHAPSASWVDGTLYLCPGSASAPYEEDDMPTLAIVEQVDAGLSVRFIPLRCPEQD